MAVGRISGPLLKANLLRNGVNLAFETDLLYLDVVNGRIGIKTASPTHDLTINGTTRTTNLDVTTQTDIATFTISGDTISSSSGTINIEPSGTSPVVYQAKIVTGDLQISTNVIETTATDQDLEIRTVGTGEVKIYSNVFVDGNLHATGTITADGDITIGNSDVDDNVVFNADIASNIVPNLDSTYDLGTDPSTGGKEWKNGYLKNVFSTSIITDTAVVNGIVLEQPQGNTIYVAVNGNDDNAGVHQNDPLATVKSALTQAEAGDTIYIYPGTYTEQFPLTVPVGVTVRGAGIRAVKIVPTTATRYNDAFLMNGETTVEDLTVADFFSGGNYFTVTAASAGSTTINVGTAPFEHTYVSGGAITIDATSYTITNAVYTHTTGILVLTHTGGTATLGSNVFVSNLTFSCAGDTRVFPDNGYGFRFATDLTVTSRSPYVRNISVLTKGSVTSLEDPLGFDAGNAGKGAYIDGAYATSVSKEASMLFHSVTFITPGINSLVATNGVRIEWLNSFIYYANEGFNAFASAHGFAQQGKTRLRIDERLGTWNTGDTLYYYDVDGTTVLASGTIETITGNYVVLTGQCTGFETLTDRAGKIASISGNAKLSTAAQKFGSSSLVLDGVGDYITYASQPDFNFGTDDFTVEFFWRPTSLGVAQVLLDCRTAATDTALYLEMNAAGNIRFYVSGAYRITSSVACTAGTFNHIALFRVGGITKLAVNGTITPTTWTDATNYPARPVRLGASWTGGAPSTGYIDEVRIVKGAAKYTTSVTVPTSAFLSDSATVLLLHLNGANNSTIILDDGITYQDIRTSGGTAKLITFADYSDFGAEIRSIGSACVYGNYGFVGDGQGVVAYLISHNFAYIGSGKLASNDPNDRIPANEVVETNNARIYYTSVDNEGNFKVGDSFFVNQKTGDVLFNGTNTNITSATGVTFSDGTNTTVITPTAINTGNIQISGNTVESVTGDVNLLSASGNINLQNNTNISGNLDVSGDITIGGNITIGNQATDTVEFVGKVNSDIVPDTNDAHNLGSITPAELRWKNVYLNRAEIDGLVIDSNTIETTVGNDDLILTANGTGRIYVPNNDVEIDQNLTVNGTVTSNSLEVITTITADKFAVTDIEITDNYITTTVADSDLELLANGTGRIYVPSNDVVIENDLTVNGTTNLTDVNIGTALVPNTVTHIGGVTQTGDVEQTGDYTLTGNLTVQGTTADLSDIRISTNTITTIGTDLDLEISANGTGKVLIPSNDVEIGQDLIVNGVATLNSLEVTTTVTSDKFTTGDIEIDNNYITTTVTDSDLELSANGTGRIYVPSNDVQLDQNLTVDGTSTLGNVNIGTILVPKTITHVGTFTHTGDVNQTGDYELTGNLTVQGTTAQFKDIKLLNNLITTTLTNSNLELEANGTGKIYVPSNDVLIDQNLTVTTDFTVSTGTTYLKDTEVTGTITQTGDIDQTGDFTTSGNTEVTGNITGTGYLQLSNIRIEGNTVSTTVTDSDLQLTANGTGNVIFEGFKFQDNNIQSVVTDSDLIFTPQGTGSVVVNSNQSLVLPVGTTGQRPGISVRTPGMIRFNSELEQYEGWTGSYWLKLSGVQDLDGNTKITAELTPGANDNTIRFYVNGDVKATIDSTKLYASKFNTNNLDIYDNNITTLAPNTDINLTTSGTGGIRLGNHRFNNNSITNVSSNAVTEFVQTGNGYVKISGKNGVVLPSGDTANDRPLAVELGLTRWNTDTQVLEIYNGVQWTSVAGSAGGVTYEEAENIGIVSAILFG